VEENDEQSTLGSMCQKNVEIALSKLTLYIQPSYDRIRALVCRVCQYPSQGRVADVDRIGNLEVRCQRVDTRGAGVEENDEQSTLGSMCQKNVEIALSKLTL
jgi:hypothetical protein